MTRVARAVLWPLAVGSLLHIAVRSSTGNAYDLAILWRGGASLASGGPLYDSHLEFIYPPLAGWLLAPLGLLPFRAAVVVVVLGGLAAAVTAAVLILRLVGVRADSPVVPGVLLLLAHSRPLIGLLAQGNIDTVLLLAEASVIALLMARRDVAAGVLLGAVCAVKPTLAPVVLALVLLQRGRALLAAAASGIVLTAVGLLTVPDRDVFITGVLPLLADGNRDVLAPYNRSIHGAAVELGLPGGLDVALRVAAFGLACWVAWRRRSGPMAPLEVVPLLMLGTMLASSFSWANYGIYLLPLLLTAARPGSLVRSWPAWAGVYLFTTTNAWHIEDLTGLPDVLLRLLPLWGWLLLLGTCAVAALRSPPPGAPEPAGAVRPGWSPPR
ncbi:glycosyltransferase family 87 protein [Blastococcus haudaquaticus]|uniref:Arabinofuranan 3-O-arabinosyltransferase n=1 Tax=Blastococcus haudaquaticus TaxID=1938745 RepID=A0A286GWW5_9ACTN|nr:glycosyltransferase family 87 protein [Blastococcus haudaquaticus]SOE00035.1 arabinofuranan 3-O-arabinosyltransferase [Blastococcus haudaquaticus]